MKINLLFYSFSLLPPRTMMNFAGNHCERISSLTIPLSDLPEFVYLLHHKLLLLSSCNKINGGTQAVPWIHL